MINMQRNEMLVFISKKVFIGHTMMQFTFYGCFVGIRDQYWLVASNVICHKPNNRLFLSQVDCLSFRGSIHFHPVHSVISQKVRQIQYPVAIGLVFLFWNACFDHFIRNILYWVDSVKLKSSFIALMQYHSTSFHINALYNKMKF